MHEKTRINPNVCPRRERCFPSLYGPQRILPIFSSFEALRFIHSLLPEVVAGVECRKQERSMQRRVYCRHGYKPATTPFDNPLRRHRESSLRGVHGNREQAELTVTPLIPRPLPCIQSDAWKHDSSVSTRPPHSVTMPSLASPSARISSSVTQIQSIITH